MLLPAETVPTRDLLPEGRPKPLTEPAAPTPAAPMPGTPSLCMNGHSNSASGAAAPNAPAAAPAELSLANLPKAVVLEGGPADEARLCSVVSPAARLLPSGSGGGCMAGVLRGTVEESMLGLGPPAEPAGRHTNSALGRAPLVERTLKKRQRSHSYAQPCVLRAALHAYCWMSGLCHHAHAGTP